MARNSFSRTVVKTICDVRYIDQNNEQRQTTITLFGDYDLQHAQRPCIRALNAKGGIVEKIKHQSYYGTMTMQEFDKYCVKTNQKEY